MIAVCDNGIVDIYEGVMITGNTAGSGGIISLYQNQDTTYYTESKGQKGKSTATLNMYGGTIEENGSSTDGVIWNWFGKLNIYGGTVKAADNQSNQYAVLAQGDMLDAVTNIYGGTFYGKNKGAVVAGKVADCICDINIMGGVFSGKDAITLAYGTINIAGGKFTGTQYALINNNKSAPLTVEGGEFLGGTKAYGGNVETKAKEVVVGDSKENKSNWNKSTSLNTYKYVMIGRIEENGTNQHKQHKTILKNPGSISSGSYYLDTDVNFSEPIIIPAGAEVNLCLNGHKLNYTGSGQAAVIVNQGGTLNICDCGGVGIITGNNAESGVLVKGNFNIYSGEVKGKTYGIKGTESGAVTLTGGSATGGAYAVQATGNARVTVSGDVTLTGAQGGIYTEKAVIASGAGQSGLNNSYDIYYHADNLKTGDTIVEGSTDTTHYRLTNPQYILKVNGSNLVAEKVLWPVKITARKDGTGWTGNTHVYTLVSNDNNKETYKADGTGTMKVPDASYHIHEDGVDTGIEVVVKGQAADVNVDYYTVTFYNGTTALNAPAPQIVRSGTKAVRPSSNPTKGNYNFDKWVTQNGGSTEFSFSTPITKKTSVYASWSPVTYTVTLNGNGGSGTALTGYAYGTGATLPTGWTKKGYIFEGWYENSGLTGTAVAKISNTATGNKAYYAKWTANTYTISYDLDGGEVSGNPGNYTIESNAITLKNPTKNGYDFTGWSGTGLTGSNNKSVTIVKGSTGNRNYTAHWSAQNYNVTLNGNEGNGTALTGYTYGTGATLPADWTRTGYTFAGWYENSGLTGTAVTKISNTETGDKTYYAKWTANTYTISYDLDGGEVSGNPENYTIESNAITLKNPTKNGYDFTGWSGTGLTGSENKIITIEKGSTGNRSYTAHWSAQNYNVSLNGNGGNGTALTGYTYGTGATLPTGWTKKGYIFEGWYENSGLTGTAVTKISNTATGDKTYYAKWTANTYTISYDLDGGEVSGNPENYTIESNAITLKNPTKNGYDFTGWSGTGLTGSENKIITIEKGSTGNRSYTAHWSAQNYNVSLNGNEGNGTALTGYTYGTGATLPADWTRTGYTFAGWYADSGLTGTAVTEISNTETGDKTYYAKWMDNILPEIGRLEYNYQPKNLWDWLIGKESLIITVPVTEEGSGADEISYTVTPEGSTASEKTTAIEDGEAKITVSADFKGTIVITCTDKAGNKSASVTVGSNLDATGIIVEDNAPQIGFQVDGGDVSAGAYDTAPDISVTVTDDTDNAISAGIASITYQIGNSEEESLQQDFTTSMKTSTTFTIPADKIPAGETEITVKVVDHAGNTVTANKTVRVMTDTEKVEAVRKVVEDVLAGYTATNSTTKQDIQEKIDAAVTNTAISGVTVIVGELDRTEATTSEAGSIRGSITIESDHDSDVTDSVLIIKTIEKLPKTETEKVDDAKKVVEEALAGITATNSATKQEMQDKINAALTQAGITDVTVTVRDFDKTEATEYTEGSISGTIVIVSNNDSDVTGSVPFNKTIAQFHTHSYTWSITKEATAEEAGEMTGTCICGDIKVEEIPKTGESESGTVIVKEDEKNECNGSFEDKEDVKGKVSLTDDEKEQLNKGEDLVIILRLRDVNVAVDTQAKTEIQNQLETNTLGTFLDIELLKWIGDTKTKITETTDEIEITFEIPEHIRNTVDTVTRTYQIMRNHDGEVDILDVENYDETAHLLTFRTDKFSTYALVYRDDAKETGTPTPKPGTTDTPGTSTPKPEPTTTPDTVLTENASSINVRLKVSRTGKKINIAWGKVTGADGYDVYVQYCGKKFTKKSITAIKGGRTTKVTVKKVNGKPLNLKKNYKIYVLAYKLVDGKKVTLAKTVIAHIAGKKNAKYTNVKEVRVKKSSYSLKAGKTATIKASTVLVSKGKKQLSNAHKKEFRYVTDNKKVATVSRKGKIKAVGTGSCTIYVYARNGCAKKIKVKVD